MAVETDVAVDTLGLIETKFQRQPLPREMVHRPRRTSWLRKRQKNSALTLVSAPAGYGKSTLISEWLETADCPTAWLSLDEQDNDVVGFLRYFVSAIQRAFPQSLQEMESLLSVGQATKPHELVHVFTNEIAHIGEFFILVLDDYHLIRDNAVHEFINELLLHRPPNLNLVICSRVDPPIALASFRAKGLVTEVRIPFLRLDAEQSSRLFRKLHDGEIGDDIRDGVLAKSEGWVTGIRLAALAARHRVRLEAVDRERVEAPSGYVTEYLISEILTRQAAGVADAMLKTSIPARLCGELAQSLGSPDGESSGPSPTEVPFDGQEFIEWMRASNLFLISLDDRGEWFRYHHLFRDFLQQELLRREGAERVTKLHVRAGRWFGERGLLEEAFYHLMPGGDTAGAIELLMEHRNAMLNGGSWVQLERHLHSFPEKTIESSPELLMIKTWLAYHHGRWGELPALIQRVESRLPECRDREAKRRLKGEIHSLRCQIALHGGDFEGAISHGRKALELLPSDLWIVRIHARVYMAGALLMSGDWQGSQRAMYGAFEEERVQTQRFRANVLSSACRIEWLAGDLGRLKLAASEAIRMCRQTNSPQIERNAMNALGMACYQLNDLQQAEKLFEGVVASPYRSYGLQYVESVCGLAMTYQAQGREAAAREVAQEGVAFLLRTGNTSQLPYLQALQAGLALKQRNLSAASAWAASLDPIPPFMPIFHGFLSPHVTLAKILVSQATPASLAKADDLLRRLHDYLAGIHCTRFLIDTLVLQALAAQAAGDTATAITSLEDALRLGQPGGFVRAFVDAGEGVAALLAQVGADEGIQAYVRTVQAACSKSQQSAAALEEGALLGELTSRELQILELLAQRLSNKEIAARLVISPGTVKGHTIRIYEKLDVKGRRQAVEKATELGFILPHL